MSNLGWGVPACEGRAMDAPILQAAALPDGGALTLYDWMACEVRDGRNLVRMDVSGREIWRAEPTLFGSNQNDCFTKFELDGDDLTAWTWSCFRVSVDLGSGIVRTREFTK